MSNKLVTMHQVRLIIHYLQRGLSDRKISKELGLSRNAKEATSDRPIDNEGIVKSITGIVTDETDKPLPGVSVKVKGTSEGMVTDLKGKFSLTIPDGGSTITIVPIENPVVLTQNFPIVKSLE